MSPASADVGAHDPALVLDGVPPIEGLPWPDGVAAGDARGALEAVRGWSDETLAARISAWAARLRVDGLRQARAVAQTLGAPLGEVCASPFGLRACALGAMRGVRVVHHELEPPPRWRVALRPDDAVAEAGAGTWRDGVLQVGRYESFLQDAPFAGFNPDHSARWTPHEVLHRVVGFWYVRGPSRWQLYLAARLNEALPVAHWYGADLVARLDEDAFDREGDAQRPDARLADARWLFEDEAALRARVERTAHHLRAGVVALLAELDAVDSSARHGQPQRVAHALLDADSDATAYVVGHHRRLCDRRVGDLLAQLPERVRHRSLDALRVAVEQTAAAVVFGPLDVSAAAEAASSERALREGWHAQLHATLQLPGLVAPTVAEGVASVLPATARWCTIRPLDLDAQLAPQLWRRAPLAVRVQRALAPPAGERHRDTDRVLASALADFEVALAGATAGDAGAERLDDGPQAPRVAANRAFRLLRLDDRLLSLHDLLLAEPDDAVIADAVGAPHDGGQQALLVGHVAGQILVLPVPDAVAEAWRGWCRDAVPTEALVRTLQSEGMADTEVTMWIDELRQARAIVGRAAP